MVVFLDTGASYEAAAVAGRILKRVLVTGEKPGGAEDVTEAETENVETF
jgi:hypothetical protein